MKQVPLVLGVCQVVIASCCQQHEEHLAELKGHHLVLVVLKGIAALPLFDEFPEPVSPLGLQSGAQLLVSGEWGFPETNSLLLSKHKEFLGPFLAPRQEEPNGECLGHY